MTSNPTLILEAIIQKNEVTMSIYERGSTVHQYEEISISLPEIKNYCEEIIKLLNKANEAGKLASGIALELKKVGQVLYDQLLTESVKRKLKNTEIEDLLIHLDEGLVQIPWELLFDGKQFLCLKFNVGRSVKTRQSLRDSGQRTIEFPVKMLVLADPTGDLKAARQEAGVIEKELDKTRRFINVGKKVTNINTSYIKKNLRDYDIVHYAGHADYDIRNPSNSGWKLEDGRFTARDISSMGATAPLPSLIFSNSCQSAHTKEWIVDNNFEEEIFGLANAFLCSGVRHYIGASWKVPDGISLCFAKEFYSQIAQGGSVGSSIRKARLRIIEDFGEDTIVWASYVLYGDPSTHLFFSPTVKRAERKVDFKKQVAFLLIALVSIAITVIGGRVLYRNYFAKQGSPEKLAWVPKNTLAILPFENLSGDKNIDWMGGGIADVMAMKLGKLEKLNIIDRVQVENVWKDIKKSEYIDKDSALKIAGMVGADRVIMGAFQKIDDNIRITVRLINVSDGAVMGTADATNKYSNLFALEDAIALDVTEKLNIRITDAERTDLKKFIPANNINAFELVAKCYKRF